jgi:hypothetical protein
MKHCFIPKTVFYFLLLCSITSGISAQAPENITIKITEEGIYIQNKYAYSYHNVWDLAILSAYLDWDNDAEFKDYGYVYFKKPGVILRVTEMFTGKDKFRVGWMTIPLVDEETEYARYGFVFKGKLYFNSVEVTGNSNINELLDCLEPGIKLNRSKREEGFREYRIDFTEKSYMTIRVRNNPRAILSITLTNDYYDDSSKYDE